MTIIGIFIAAVSVLLAFFAVSAAGLILGGVLLFEASTFWLNLHLLLF